MVGLRRLETLVNTDAASGFWVSVCTPFWGSFWICNVDHIGRIIVRLWRVEDINTGPSNYHIEYHHLKKSKLSHLFIFVSSILPVLVQCIACIWAYYEWILVKRICATLIAYNTLLQPYDLRLLPKRNVRIEVFK